MDIAKRTKRFNACIHRFVSWKSDLSHKWLERGRVQLLLGGRACSFIVDETDFVSLRFAGEQFAGRTPLLCGWLLVIKELSAVSYMKVPTIADVVCKHSSDSRFSTHIYN